MQTRVACPACQTVLGVDPAYGDGARFRCPQCNFEFSVQLPQRPAHNQPLAPWPAQGQADTTQSSGSLVWIVSAAVGAGAVISIVCVVLMLSLMRKAAPANNPQDTAQSVAVNSSDAHPTTAAASAPSLPVPAVASSPANSPSALASGQPVSSIAPPSAFPPPGPVMPVPGAPGAPLLAYRFNGGEEYAYTFTAQADIAGSPGRANGMCTLKLSSGATPAEFAAQTRQGQGNGSGFIITSDGYIVTCAHVVEGSTKIEAVLGAQTYPASVVAFDKEHDLAVVRIAAANLPTVPLANSDAVELGQEVRAVGFPLSNLLGESVKITRGTIAGVVNTSGRKLFQVDASINPGNSGGPLVNEMGQVVGVASAKLTGEDIDGVGFAVPASEVLSLLRSKGISASPARPGQKLDGTTLARTITPAVAMIKVTIGPGGFGAANRLTLDYSGNVTTSSAPRAVGRMRMPGMPNFEMDHGQLLMSERGELLSATGNVQLPYLLGPVGSLAIEPLADGNQRTWQVQHATSLTQIISDESNSPFPMHFRRRSRSPFGNPFGQNQPKVVVTPAMETSNYELTGTNGDLATIVKRYNFQTLDAAGAPPVAKMTGEGTITFNRAKGCAEKFEFKATLVRTVSNVTVTVPVTLEWRRLSQAELDQMRAQGKANLEAAKQANAERAARQAKAGVGEDTAFVGGTGGGADRYVDETSLLYGIECTYSQWMNEQCINKLTPIFARDQERKLPAGAVAREGYAVGAVNVYAQKYVNGIQLIFMRVRDDGQLDPGDSYTSEWLGMRGTGQPRTLTGDGHPIIGVHIRRGLIVDAMALVVDRNPRSASAK